MAGKQLFIIVIIWIVLHYGKSLLYLNYCLIQNYATLPLLKCAGFKMEKYYELWLLYGFLYAFLV
jgi:hypothetical protein